MDSWMGRLASVTAISIEEFEWIGQEPANHSRGDRTRLVRKRRCNYRCTLAAHRYRMDKPFPAICRTR